MKKTMVLVVTVLTFLSLAATNVEARSDNASVNASAAKAKAETKLETAKLRVCQNKEDSIKKRNSQLEKMTRNMLEKFDAIAERAKEHYASKVEPAGAEVENYDTLLMDMAVKKLAVMSALANAKADADVFDCDGDSPKEKLSNFREDMQAVKKALKEYRTAIKEYIAAMRSASLAKANETTSDENK